MLNTLEMESIRQPNSGGLRSVHTLLSPCSCWYNHVTRNKDLKFRKKVGIVIKSKETSS